ncbi:CRISPR-associated endoribonuclease Cas2 [Bordetella tumbae]|uniref:hypothetical protein n=1 Tax=Bordetella tumbae TaxID=1649139 RepID=UPI0039F017B5
MALYFLSYDLRKARNYQPLYDALKAVNAVRVLESLWAFKLDGVTCAQLRDHFKQFIDKDDGLCVDQSVDWATYNALATPPQ